MNIDINDYDLINPSSIKIVSKNKTMYDITVEDDHTFFIYLNEKNKILTHNCDGQHISALIISFFHRWFPHIIEHKKLYRIITPLVACEANKDKHYFYTLEEYENFAKTTKTSNHKYLKGLGSLSLKDWEYVMSHKTLFSIIDDRSANRFLDIAFGENVQKRKDFLAGRKYTE